MCCEDQASFRLLGGEICIGCAIDAICEEVHEFASFERLSGVHEIDGMDPLEWLDAMTWD
jgi:hypothetical protein